MGTEPDELEKWVGKQVNRNCPNGHPFIVRRNRDDDSLFLGCSKYPECRETDEISASLQLRMIGAPQLPGMGKKP